MLNKIINPSTPRQLLISKCLVNPLYRPNASSRARKIGYIAALLSSGFIYYYVWKINKLEHEIAHQERMAEYFERQFNSTERDYMLMKNIADASQARLDIAEENNAKLVIALGHANKEG